MSSQLSHIVNIQDIFLSGYVCCHICRGSKGEFYDQYSVLRQPSYVVSRTLIALTGPWYEDSVTSVLLHPKEAFLYVQGTDLQCSKDLCSCSTLITSLTQLTVYLGFVALMKWPSMTFQPQWTLFWRRLARNKCFTLAIHRAPQWVCEEMDSLEYIVFEMIIKFHVCGLMMKK